MPPHYNDQQAHHHPRHHPHRHSHHHHHDQESCSSYGTMPAFFTCGSASSVNNVATTATTTPTVPGVPFNCALQNEYNSQYERAIDNAFAKLQNDDQHTGLPQWATQTTAVGAIMLNSQKKRGKPQKPKYNVKFFPEVVIYTIPNVSVLSQEEFSSMYLSRAEMTNIHRDAWKMVDLMNLGIEYEDVNPEDDQERQGGFSKRGLEDLKTTNVDRRRKMRENAYKVVFGVQAFHNGRQPIDEMGDNGDEILGDLYRRVAAPARADAHRVALADAKAAGYIIF